MAEQRESGGPHSRFDRPVAYVSAVLLLLVVGGGASAYLILTRSGPSGEPEQNPPRLVRVFQVQKASHRIAISGYGTSQASQLWTAIAEVSGRAEEVNPRFERGEILPADTWLVRIDPTDYQLARDRYQAEAEAQRRQIDELDQRAAYLKDLLKLQQRQLRLAEAEYERQRTMRAKRATSVAALEAAERALVAQRAAVRETSHNLALTPVERRRLEESLKAANARLKQARRDLDRCEIRLPPDLDARCASKTVEDDQFVAAGQSLGTFLALRTAEVVAMLETGKVASLLGAGREDSQKLDLTEIIGRRGLLWREFPIPAHVSWTLGERRVVWPGRLARIGSSLDPGTRTVPLIIEVPNPYEDVRLGVRPPLLPEVFCEVTVYGATVDDVAVIPRDALHDGRVYLLRRDSRPGGPSEGRVDGGAKGQPGEPPRRAPAGARLEPGDRVQGKLHIQPVDVLVLEDDLAVIRDGLDWGELVILSDVPRAEVLREVPVSSEAMPLRGRVIENPAKPRRKVAFPEGLFDEAEKLQDRPPHSTGHRETTP